MVFDRDGTLLRDNADQLIGRYQSVMPELTADDLTQHWQRVGHLAPAHRDKDREFWAEFFRYVSRSKGGSREQADKLTKIFLQTHTMYTLLPDTLPCLMQLRRRGYRLAILTNHPLGDVETGLRHVGLEPAWFEAIVNAYPHRKPSVLAYQRVLDALQIAAAACLFVDNEPDNVRGAIAVGMQAVLIDRSEPGTIHPGIVTVNTLDYVSQLTPERA